MGKWENGEMGEWENGEMGEWESEKIRNQELEIRNYLVQLSNHQRCNPLLLRSL